MLGNFGDLAKRAGELRAAQVDADLLNNRSELGRACPYKWRIFRTRCIEMNKRRGP